MDSMVNVAKTGQVMRMTQRGLFLVLAMMAWLVPGVASARDHITLIMPVGWELDEEQHQLMHDIVSLAPDRAQLDLVVYESDTTYVHGVQNVAVDARSHTLRALLHPEPVWAHPALRPAHAPLELYVERARAWGATQVVVVHTQRPQPELTRASDVITLALDIAPRQHTPASISRATPQARPCVGLLSSAGQFLWSLWLLLGLAAFFTTWLWQHQRRPRSPR